MRDYTSNNFCDFLWIGDLLDLKQNDNREFVLETNRGGKPTKLSISNVIVFGTIVEVKQLGNGGLLYQVDDGTGVITCNHSEEKFQEFIDCIENEKIDVRNETFGCSITDISSNDSIFNDRSIQIEEIKFNKESRLYGLQSIWDDIHKSFHGLIEPYSIGDSVIIQGRLYSYIHTNQIYVNNIRALGVDEEMIYVSVKLEDGLDKSRESEASRKQTQSTNRMSGLLTFDNIPQLNPKIVFPRNIQSPEVDKELPSSTSGILSPKLETAMTFDTFTSKRIRM